MPSMRAAGVFQPVMGHEFTGTISALGEGVNGFSIGEPVVVHPGGLCGECYFCKSGAVNLCAEQTGTGYREQGAYAERVAVRAKQALRLSDTSSLERAALTEPLGVAIHSLNRGVLRAGETVFIAGGGPIGLLTLLAAKHQDAGKIVVSEPAASRRELSLRLGAHHAVDPAQGPSVQVREITRGLGRELCRGRARPPAPRGACPGFTAPRHSPRKTSCGIQTAPSRSSGGSRPTSGAPTPA